MAVSAEYKAYIEELLEDFGPVDIRSMFGGAGIFRDSVMFGLIAYETLYLKAGDANRADFEAEGMGPFTYEGKSKPVSMSYFELPERLYDDAAELSEWARKAYDVALAAKKKPPRN